MSSSKVVLYLQLTNLVYVCRIRTVRIRSGAKSYRHEFKMIGIRMKTFQENTPNIFKLMPAVLNSFKCVIIKLNHKFVSFSYKRNHIGSDLCDKDENSTPFIFKWGEDSCFSFVTAWRIIKSSFHFLLVCSSSFDSFNLSNKINNKYLCRNFNRW